MKSVTQVRHVTQVGPDLWAGRSVGYAKHSNLCDRPYTMETLKKFLEDSRFRRKNHVPNFGSTEKIFFGKVGNFFDHQGRSKICLRIEWEHSQPPRKPLDTISRACFFYFLNFLKNHMYGGPPNEIL